MEKRLGLQRLVIVTGAAGGIGRALVSGFSANGFRVIGLDHAPRPDGLECWQYLQTDLQRLVAEAAYAADTLKAITDLVGDGGLVVLVNNAAVQVLGGVGSLTLADWHSTLDVNLLAPFVLTQGLLPQLEAATGSVINISSIHARLTKANFVAYATSKAALSGMTRAMAVDVGGRVRVNAIEPAAIATDMLQAGFADRPDQYAQLQGCHPQGRIGTPEEVAALALAIADGALRFLHGACIGMDGGISNQLHDPVA
ncbi:Short-chain dehydrogenase OS=Stutzerimonas stutzeri OX=316 GN=PS273GM_03570 PE=3 SV=1 [Stutzerimonas stutzeri]